MKIIGLQKLTLLDYPGKVACTVFTEGCNFRCPFCQNSKLVLPNHQAQSISSESVLQFLKKRKGLLDGICISGGEPLIHPEIYDFILQVKTLDYAVKIDTNGSYPSRLKELVQHHLIDYIAMDIKSSPERYCMAAGTTENPITQIEESVNFIMQCNIPYEFRTTVVKELHTAEEFAAIGHWLKKAKAYYLQGFVDSEQVLQQGLHAYTKEEMEGFLDIIRTYIPNTFIRGL